jgi:hypothetical protein
MSEVNFSTMSMNQLIAFYNRNADIKVTRFSDRKTAERRCSALFALIVKNLPEPKPESISRPNMKASLKLDRTITCIITGGIWKNAYQMWKERPDWMTTAQQDRLTSQLYKAAKEGRKIIVEVNGREFELVNVEQKGV